MRVQQWKYSKQKSSALWSFYSRRKEQTVAKNYKWIWIMTIRKFVWWQYETYEREANGVFGKGKNSTLWSICCWWNGNKHLLDLAIWELLKGRAHENVYCCLQLQWRETNHITWHRQRYKPALKSFNSVWGILINTPLPTFNFLRTMSGADGRLAGNV